MTFKKLNSQDINTILFACAILLVGIMFCCFGVQMLSYIIGGFMIFLGILFAVNSILRTRALLTTNGLIGMLLSAFGSMIIVRNLAGIIFEFIPWIMLFVGALIIADSFLRYFLRKDIHITVFITELAVGIVVTVLALCVRFIDDFANFASVVFGIVLIVYSLFIIFTTLVKKN